jgi:hypothetical protein
VGRNTYKDLDYLLERICQIQLVESLPEKPLSYSALPSVSTTEYSPTFELTIEDVPN